MKKWMSKLAALTALVVAALPAVAYAGMFDSYTATAVIDAGTPYFAAVDAPILAATGLMLFIGLVLLVIKIFKKGRR